MKILVIALLLWVAAVWLLVLTGIEERDEERVIEERIRRDKFHVRPDEQDTQKVHKIIRFSFHFLPRRWDAALSASELSKNPHITNNALALQTVRDGH